MKVPERSELEEAKRLSETGELDQAIRFLVDGNRTSRDPEVERRIRDLRSQAGAGIVAAPDAEPSFPEPVSELPMPGPSGVPELGLEQLTPTLIRTSILKYGCVFVRGLLASDRAEELAAEIKRAFEVRAGLGEGESDGDGYYDELQVEPPNMIVGRPFVERGGGLFAADSPRVMFEMLDAFADAGLPSLIEGYLGEPTIVSAEKCTLRRTTADLPKAWHQDGKFMGDVRALNVWLSLSHCGVDSPGLDIVPRRIEQLAESGGEGTIIDIEVKHADAEILAGDAGISRPVFGPGDALIFDDLFLHQTGSDSVMSGTRYAIESWFFGRSAFPEAYTPIAV